jgi:quinol monooxygenase YgiN
MSEPIVYIDSSEIREGKLEELKAAVRELVEFVHANEPRLLSYNFYFNEGGTRMTVVAVHPDSASMEFHMKVAGPAFRGFTEFIDLSTIEVYGKLSDVLLTQLRQKAQMLGSGTVHVHEKHAGFVR